MCDCPVPAAVLSRLPHHLMSVAVKHLSPAWSSNPPALFCDRCPRPALLLHRPLLLLTLCSLVSSLVWMLISLVGHHLRFVLLPFACRPPVCFPKDSQRKVFVLLLSSHGLVQVLLLEPGVGRPQWGRLGKMGVEMNLAPCVPV